MNAKWNKVKATRGLCQASYDVETRPKAIVRGCGAPAREAARIAPSLLSRLI